MGEIKINIGCSTFNNRYWQPAFYPEDLPRSKWFEYYCSQFNTYEINVTFYKNPTIRTLQNWYKKAPADFRYSVKAPKQITHVRRFLDCREEIDQFYNSCREGLAEKLDFILFQVPPSFSYSADNLAAVLSNLDPAFKNAVEFRNSSWWREDVFAALEKHSITFCNVSYPGLPDEIISTSATGYVRLHGNPRLFYSGYSDVELTKLCTELARNEKFSEVNVYFNNTAGVDGILNAVRLAELGVQLKNKGWTASCKRIII